MTGGSYDGTIAIGAAAEQPMSGRHPDALAAIIPIRAIDRWYDYHYFNGVQSSSHMATPALFTTALPAGDTQNAGTDDPLLPVHIVERKACMATMGQLTNAGYASPYQDARSAFWRQRDFTRSAPGFRAATFIIHGLFDSQLLQRAPLPVPGAVRPGDPPVVPRAPQGCRRRRGRRTDLRGAGRRRAVS
jgi:X-Pro dipeptidyl-peptidase